MNLFGGPLHYISSFVNLINSLLCDGITLKTNNSNAQHLADKKMLLSKLEISSKLKIQDCKFPKIFLNNVCRQRPWHFNTRNN